MYLRWIYNGALPHTPPKGLVPLESHFCGAHWRLGAACLEMEKRFICKTLEGEKSQYCQQNQSNRDDQPPDFTFCYSITRFRTNAPAGTSCLQRNEQSMTA